MQRRLGATLAGAAVLALGLTACAPSNTPTAYDSVTEQNFLEGCLNRYVNRVDDTLAVTDDTLSSDVAGGSQQQCECQYQLFVEQVPFNSSDTSQPGYAGPNFTDLNKSLEGDNGQQTIDSLPSEFQDELQACARSAESGPAGSATTLPTETTTTLPPTSQNTTPDGRPLDG